jgi:hypothetical protein
MAAGGERLEAPPLVAPGKVVRTAGQAFRSDPLFRTVAITNFAFLGAFLSLQWLLGLESLLEPLTALLLYLPLAIGQWRFWRLGNLDTKTAMVFIHLHEKAFKDTDELEALENPGVIRGDHFRVAVETHLSLRRAAGRATYVFSIALTFGAIMSTLFFPNNLGQQLSLRELAARSTSVAFLTFLFAFAIGWILPPLWLVEDAGVRYYHRRLQSVEQVARWYLIQLGPFLGVGAFGTFFLIYYIAGFTLVDAIIALLQLSLSLYPASLTATYLYQRYRERAAVERLKNELEKHGMREYPSAVTALVRLQPR